MKYLSIKNRGSELTVAVTLRPTDYVLNDGVNVPQLFDDITKLVASKTSPNKVDDVKPLVQTIPMVKNENEGIFKNGGKDGDKSRPEFKPNADFKPKVIEPINTIGGNKSAGLTENRDVVSNPGNPIKESIDAPKTPGIEVKKAEELTRTPKQMEKIEKPKEGVTVEDFKMKWKFDDIDFADWIKFELPKLSPAERKNLTDISWKPYLGGEKDGKN